MDESCGKRYVYNLTDFKRIPEHITESRLGMLGGERKLLGACHQQVEPKATKDNSGAGIVPGLVELPSLTFC